MENNGERDSPFNIASGTITAVGRSAPQGKLKAKSQGEEWIHPSKERTSAATAEGCESRKCRFSPLHLNFDLSDVTTLLKTEF